MYVLYTDAMQPVQLSDSNLDLFEPIQFYVINSICRRDHVHVPPRSLPCTLFTCFLPPHQVGSWVVIFNVHYLSFSSSRISTLNILFIQLPTRQVPNWTFDFCNSELDAVEQAEAAEMQVQQIPTLKISARTRTGKWNREQLTYLNLGKVGAVLQRYSRLYRQEASRMNMTMNKLHTVLLSFYLISLIFISFYTPFPIRPDFRVRYNPIQFIIYVFLFSNFLLMNLMSGTMQYLMTIHNHDHGGDQADNVLSYIVLHYYISMALALQIGGGYGYRC